MIINDVSIAMIIVLVLVLALLCMALTGIISLCFVKGWSWSFQGWQFSPELMFSPFSVLTSKLTHSFSKMFQSLLLKASGCSVCGSLVGWNDSMELNEDDLKELVSYISETDGGLPWQFLMERSTPTLAYQAWYREPQFGPIQYHTRTVFRNVSPELVRDFFWDDEFRSNWDNMLVYFSTLDMFPQTGTMIVHWIRKLPLYHRDREYVIIRRIWESRSTYYCVTKGTTHPSFPRDRETRRVNQYYSSWYIRPAESRNGEQPTGSEVLLFHHEDMGIPKKLVKMGVRAGMWNLIKRLDMGIQAYNTARANGAAPSSYARMARRTTKVSLPTVSLPRLVVNTERRHKHRKSYVIKWLVVGGILVAGGISFARYWRANTSSSSKQQQRLNMLKG